ncbi:MAG: M28 family peptidase [Acidobacteria bacterium]|nr:M28 family peptidase [Acidobacteriota bacterium]
MNQRKRLTGRLATVALIFAFCASALGANFFVPQTPANVSTRKATLTADESAALGRISADSLRGHLSFIASDALEGRDTPSRGLDLAAEYIAAQFRRAGLEPVGDDNYFQAANWSRVERNLGSFKMELDAPPRALRVERSKVSLASSVSGFTVWSADGPLTLERAGVLAIDYKDASLTREQVEGKVVLTELPDLRRQERERLFESYQAQKKFLDRLSELKAALVVTVDRNNPKGVGAGVERLLDPENRQPSARARAMSVSIPVIAVHDTEFATEFDALKSLKPEASKATLTLHLDAPIEHPVSVRNVAGVLRGSDPLLKDTYVIVSAHYDHLGVRDGDGGDRVFNGANDDGSGTVSVVELAAALSTLKQRPKRSIVFMAFFGEEKGLLGSRYYGRHPLVPLARTVAQVNLEQVGRTDDSEGPQVGSAAVTGFDYSDVGAVLREAGELTGVKVYKHPTKSDAFFGRSDNQALADTGVPAHTLSVAFEYPDYHAVGDEWQKVDYNNMTKVLRMVGAGVLLIAGNPQEPKWNESNPKAARYAQAWKELHRQ